MSQRRLEARRMHLQDVSAFAPNKDLLHGRIRAVAPSSGSQIFVLIASGRQSLDKRAFGIEPANKKEIRWQSVCQERRQPGHSLFDFEVLANFTPDLEEDSSVTDHDTIPVNMMDIRDL